MRAARCASRIFARAAAMPSAKAHRYLVSLARAGTRGTGPGDIALPPRAADAARGARRARPLRRAQARRARVGGDRRAHGRDRGRRVWGTHGPTHVRLVEARHELAATVPPGHVCPLTYSAAGLVFCAYGDPRLTAPLAEREMAQSRATGRPSAPTTPRRSWSAWSGRCARRASLRWRTRGTAGSPPSRRRCSMPMARGFAGAVGVRSRRAAQRRARRARGGADGRSREVARRRVARIRAGGRPALKSVVGTRPATG